MGKLATLLVEIGTDITGIDKGVKQAVGHLDNLDRAASRVGKAIAGYFSAQMILGAVNAALDFAGAMTDLSARTGIGVESLQELKYAGEQVGVSLDATVAAIGQLQNRLAGGDKSAASALEQLGIAFNDIRNAAPDQMLRMVATAIKDIEDPAKRTQLAMDLMGRGALAAMPLLVSNMDELIGKARELGVIVDSRTIAALDDMGDTITSLKSVGIALVAEFLVPFAPLLGQIANAGLGFVRWIQDAQVAFEQLLSIGAGWMASFRQFQADYLSWGGASERLGQSAAEWRDVSEQLGVSQTKVADATKKTAEAGVVWGEGLKGIDKTYDEIFKIADRLFGEDLVSKASQYLQALDAMGGKMPRLKAGHEDLIKVLREGVEAMEALGRTGTAEYDKLIAKYREAAGLTREGLLPSTHLGVDLFTGPNAGPAQGQDVVIAEHLIDTAKDWEDANAEVIKMQDEYMASLARTTEATAAAAASHNGQVEGMAGPWHALKGAVNQAAAAIKLAMPKDMDWGTAYAHAGAAGLMKHPGMGGLMPTNFYKGFAGGTDGYENFGSGTPVMLHGWEKVTPRGAGNGGDTIHVNVSGVLLSNNPAARDELRRFIGETLTDGIKRSRKFSY